MIAQSEKKSVLMCCRVCDGMMQKKNSSIITTGFENVLNY